MIKLSFPNINTVIADMSRFAHALDGGIVKKAAPLMQKEFFKSNKKTFKNLGGAHGKWKPLSEDYAAWKQRHYPGKPLMVLNGDLKNSLTKKDDNNIYDPSYSNNIFRLVLGSQIEYGIFHQVGAGRLPVRRVVDPDSPAIRNIFNVLQKELVYAIKQSPFKLNKPLVPPHWNDSYSALK